MVSFHALEPVRTRRGSYLRVVSAVILPGGIGRDLVDFTRADDSTKRSALMSMEVWIGCKGT